MSSTEKKHVDTPIGFEDSSLMSYTMVDRSVTATLEGWDERTVYIKFIDVILLIYKSGDVISGLVEVFGDYEELEEAVKREYEKVPENHGYRAFQLLDI